MKKILFTSESVSEGHPDKVCDQISDAILDACLAEDPYSRVACECFTTTNLLVIGGEITTQAQVNYEQIARNVLCQIGYTSDEIGIDGHHCEIKNVIGVQSSDIALGTNKEVGGAGDQGIMFGYASNETEGYMPLPISIAHHLVRYATEKRHSGEFQWARPDMKSQVTVDYTDALHPRIDTILMSIQHDPDFDEKAFKDYIQNVIMQDVVKKYGMNTDYKVLINPTGRFVIGGPHGDTGLTGRKIIVDTYGGSARHGGGASLEKILLKLIVVVLIWQDIWLKILWQPDFVNVLKFNCLMLLGSKSQQVSLSKLMEQKKYQKMLFYRLLKMNLI